MKRSFWFWLGWVCLVGALAGLVAESIAPAAQLLLIGFGIVAFFLGGSSDSREPGADSAA